MNIESLPDGVVPTIIVAAIVLLTSSLPILKFFKESFIDLEMSRFRKIINTQDYENSLSRDVKKSLMEARDRAAFERIHGLNLNTKNRRTVLGIVNKKGVNIDIEDIKQSFFYINLRNGLMIIKYRPWIKSLENINIIIGILSAIISLTPIFTFIFLYKQLNDLDIVFLLIIIISYAYFAFDRFKQAKFLRSVIRILAQADQLPQYIKVDEDWWFKKILHKIHIRPKTFIERDFDKWQS